jgi:glutamate/tyrosine decarboxylase-like PLP-dependent enzyme
MVHKRVLISTDDMFDGGVVFDQIRNASIVGIEVVTVPLERKNDNRIILRELIRAAEEGRSLKESSLTVPTTFNIDFDELERADLVLILDKTGIYVVKDTSSLNKMARVMDLEVEELPNVSVLSPTFN